MRTFVENLIIFNAVSLTTATFTAAVTNIITANTHGLSNGDAVILTTDNTLPAGLSVNTVYYVQVIDANTFTLSIDKAEGGNGTAVDVTDTGTGNHTWTIKSFGEPVLCTDFRHIKFWLATSGMGAGDSIVVKVQESNQEYAPDWGSAKSATNEWDYVQNIDTEDGSTIDGDTGISFADSDDLRKFVINIDGTRWINLIITTMSDVANTSVTAKASLYSNG